MKLYRKKFEQLTQTSMTEEEEHQLRRSVMSFCTMQELSENNVMLYRIAKSSDAIARKCYERHAFIPHNANSVVEDIYHQNGLSLTTSEYIITCLMYGDVLVEVPFDKKRLQENDMLEMQVFRCNNGLNEYIADKILTGNIFSLSEPNTLKKILALSNNQNLRGALNKPSEEDIGRFFELFELNQTSKYWSLIKARYHALAQLHNGDEINILRTELDNILTYV